jgi:hypothetical protein
LLSVFSCAEMQRSPWRRSKFQDGAEGMDRIDARLGAQRDCECRAVLRGCRHGVVRKRRRHARRCGAKP